MTNLTKAHDELYRRGPDETFATMQDLWDHCYRQRERSTDRWHAPGALSTRPEQRTPWLWRWGATVRSHMNDWSFSALCRLAGMQQGHGEPSLPRRPPASCWRRRCPGAAPSLLQLLTEEDRIRSIHGAAYTRLWNMDLLFMIREFATDFQPPRQAVTGGTGCTLASRTFLCS